MDSTLLGHISRCLIFYHFLSFRAAHLSFSLFSSPLYKLKCSCEGWTFELPNQNVTPPEHILVMKDDKKDSPLVILVVIELWGSSQTLTGSGSRGPCVPRFSVCSCPLSFSSALSPALLSSLFFCYSVLPNTPMSCHLSHHCRGNICFSDARSEITFRSQNLSTFSTLLRRVTAAHRWLSLGNRSLSDSPLSTGWLLETQYCPISPMTPQ